MLIADVIQMEKTTELSRCGSEDIEGLERDDTEGLERESYAVFPFFPQTSQNHYHCVYSIDHLHRIAFRNVYICKRLGALSLKQLIYNSYVGGALPIIFIEKSLPNQQHSISWTYYTS